MALGYATGSRHASGRRLNELYKRPSDPMPSLTSGDTLVLTAGTHVLAPDTPISGLSDVTVRFDRGAVVRWDSTAGFAFNVQGCSGLKFLDAVFVGEHELDTAIRNLPAIKLRECSNTRIQRCSSDLGGGLVQQDATALDLGSMVIDCDITRPRSALRVRNAAVIENVRISWPTDIEWDRVLGVGPSHGIYLFGGSRDVVIRNCRIENCRKTGIKVSGTTLKLSDIRIVGNSLIDCGQGVEVGGDGVTDGHESIDIRGNTLIDCGTNRVGWNEGRGIRVLGSKGCTVAGNSIRFKRANLGPANAFHAIQVARYDGASDQVESVLVEGNQVTADDAVSPGAIGVSGILLASVAGPALIRGNMVTGVGGQAYRAESSTRPRFIDNSSFGVSVHSECVLCDSPEVRGSQVSSPTSGNAQIRFSSCTAPAHSGNGDATVSDT